MSGKTSLLLFAVLLSVLAWEPFTAAADSPDPNPRRWEDLIKAAATQPAPPANKENRIVGRVVDAAGRGLADARVTAQSSSLGRELWWAFKQQATTDADGRFELPVPFADVLYELATTRMTYYQPGRVTVVPDHGGQVLIQLVPQKADQKNTLQGAVTDPDGAPAANVDVELVGEYGKRAAGRTDNDGQFRLTDLDLYLGQAIPVARSGDLVAPLSMIAPYSRPKSIGLRLGPGATLEGTVVDQDHADKPVANATVVILPTFSSDFRMEAVTDQDGKYSLPGIPAGLYHVTATAATHFIRPKAGQLMNLPKIKLDAGATKAVNLQMQPKAVMAGKVVDPEGKPVAGAMVGAMTTWWGGYQNQYTWVLTDRDGWFILPTAHTAEKLIVSAFSSQSGLGMTQTQTPQPGGVDETLVIRLGGTSRILGKLADPAGQPIKDGLCLADGAYPVSALSGADGKFDLGRVALQSRPDIQVVFRAPRPERNTTITYSLVDKAYKIADRKTAPTFYLNHIEKPTLEPGKTAELNITLQPTALLEISGRITGAAGKPAAAARVHLFTGDAKADTWLHTVHPQMSSSEMNETRDTEIGAAVTDKDGRWTLWTVRENGVATPMGGPDTDWTHFCIGIDFSGTDSAELKNRFVPDLKFSPGESKLELNIDMGLAPLVPVPVTQPGAAPQK